MAADYTFYEFFSGGGMARLGLGPKWRCIFANDWCEKKAAAYRVNFRGEESFCRGDLRKLGVADLRGKPDLVWGSFPCQDLSLAGAGAGLRGTRSGVFWPFWRLVEGLNSEGRGPSIVVLENVVGTLTSHDGQDFRAISRALSEAGFRFGALVMDAVHFIPHSRPRLFVVGVADDIHIPEGLVSPGPVATWHSPALREAHGNLSTDLRMRWIWWNVPKPICRQSRFADILEPDDAVKWNTPAETTRLLSLMSAANLEKVRTAREERSRVVGCVYKRTRVEDGIKLQRAEVRFDGLSGCLRTPGGGSSRQTVIVVSGNTVRSRLLSTREAARLMGLPEAYQLPEKYNDAYHLCGDGVAVPVVSWLEQHLLRPLVEVRANSVADALKSRRDGEALGAVVNA
jgi:DNA (cytosine-5)-methyltransferase 1